MAGARERIIEATLQLITEQGLSGVTMVEVARTAGVARATLYNHYSDVPSILAEAIARHNDQAIVGLRQNLATASSPSDTIEHLVHYVASISAHGHTIELHHGLPPVLRDELAAFDDELEARIQQTLDSGLATGEFRSTLDVPATTTLIRHMLAGVSELVAAAPQEAPRIAVDANCTILAAIAHQASSSAD
jgi:AcrR family transcriptional regulator